MACRVKNIDKITKEVRPENIYHHVQMFLSQFLTLIRRFFRPKFQQPLYQ